MQYNLIVILGPTASGKTKLAAHIAHELDGEIISADSRQVYREMNIGTGKDYMDYVVNGKPVPYHLIDIVNPGTKYHVHQFIQDFELAYQSIIAQKKQVILCGGTGMYIDALLNNYQYTSIPVNPEIRDELKNHSHAQLISYFESLPIVSYTTLADKSTSKRLIRAIEICRFLESNNSFIQDNNRTFYPIIFGVAAKSVEERRSRILSRLEKRFNSGLIDEVKRLLQKIDIDDMMWYGLEYKFVCMHLEGKLTEEDLKEKLTIAIQQFAKRQMTYFRKMERDGKLIHWIDASLPFHEQFNQINRILKNLTPLIK